LSHLGSRIIAGEKEGCCSEIEFKTGELYSTATKERGDVGDVAAEDIRFMRGGRR